MSENKNNPKSNAEIDAPMPKDFWQLVREARVKAQAEISRKREAVYKTFITEEVKAGKRIPMPNNFWQIATGGLDLQTPLIITEELASDNVGEDLLLREGRNVTTKEGQEKLEGEEVGLVKNKQTEEKKGEKDLASDSEKNFEKMQRQPASLQEHQKVENRETERVNSIKEFGEQTRGLSFKEVALKLLLREARDLTAREIVQMAISEGLLISTGKTPDASLAGQIYTDIHRNREVSPFIIVGPRRYSLKIWQKEEEKPIKRLRTVPLLKKEKEQKIVTNNEKYLPNRKMSYKQVATYLLDREQRPMTAKEIVTIAIKEGLIESSGKTPDATLAGQLYTEIQRAGQRAAIKIIGPRTYALAEWFVK